MATGTLAVTNTFASGATITAAGFNTNFTDVVNYINNRNDGTDEWQLVKVTSSTANCVVIVGSAATTEVSIDNTATDGDPILTWKIGGTTIISMGPDDSDSDIFKVGTTAITTNIAMQIPTTGVQVQFPLGSATTPSVSFIGDTNTGFYSATADRINFSTGGTLRMSVDSTQLDVVPIISGPAGTFSAPAFTFSADLDTGMFRIGANNLGFAAGGTQVLDIQSTVLLTLVTLTPNGGGALSTGDGTNYWNDISYKSLTDRGCLPFCDDGVELSDGRIVSDTEAIRSIVKHPTKKTIHGLPMLDYKTFPKKSYTLAATAQGLLPRDENDDPIGGSDGVEMTMMFGVFIGAIKELTDRIEVLEKK